MLRIFIILSLLFAPTLPVYADECLLEDYKRPIHKQRRHFCTPFSGERITDEYTNGKKILCESMEVDHCVSLSWARKNGVCGDDLKRLANDPRNLLPTFWLTNRKKGSKSLHEFAETLTPSVKRKILARCEPVLKAYSIVAKKDLMNASLSRYNLEKLSAKTPPIPYYLLKKALPLSLKDRLVVKKVSGRSVVFLGKRVVGYAVGVGAALEVITLVPMSLEKISLWTAEDFNDNKKARNEFFKEIIEDW